MRTIDWTNRFKRDYRRELRGQHGRVLDSVLSEVLPVLQADQPLAERHRDHPLTGNWAEHRDCHIKPDLVLIYQKTDDNTLRLVRLGSHSELGL
jgi:mRNA interferase YafQ